MGLKDVSKKIGKALKKIVPIVVGGMALKGLGGLLGGAGGKKFTEMILKKGATDLLTNLLGGSKRSGGTQKGLLPIGDLDLKTFIAAIDANKELEKKRTRVEEAGSRPGFTLPQLELGKMSTLGRDIPKDYRKTFTGITHKI